MKRKSDSIDAKLGRYSIKVDRKLGLKIEQIAQKEKRTVKAQTEIILEAGLSLIGGEGVPRP